MKYLVDEIYLKKYKKLVEGYIQHDTHCDWYMTECCDCGMSDRIRELQQMSKDKIIFTEYQH